MSSDHSYPEYDFTFTRMTRTIREGEQALAAGTPMTTLDAILARDEALGQLARDDTQRDAGETVMRTNVTPGEHALLLAVRALKEAKQAYADAYEAEQRAQVHYYKLTEARRRAGDTLDDTLSSYDDTLAQTTAAVPPRAPGEGDCS